MATPRRALALQTFRLRNFKAVRDSGTVRFTPLTVFIGNNGSGKSSLIEGLETFQTIVHKGLDDAMDQWGGFEQILNKSQNRIVRYDKQQRQVKTHPMIFNLSGDDYRNPYTARMTVNAVGDELFIQDEEVRLFWSARNSRSKNKVSITKRDSRGKVTIDKEDPIIKDPPNHSDGRALFRLRSLELWQFLSLNPAKMVSPRPRRRTELVLHLDKDGANLVNYLNDIAQSADGIEVLNGIIETLRYVLPYAADVQVASTSELQRTLYLQLSEAGFKVPSWLFSTGTLRVLAILAVLRHPLPPRLLCIDEIENGLDPRTLNLVVEEIRYAVESGRTQVIATTHSPYLLDLLTLSQIVVVERDETGQPIFFRPDEERLREWSKNFAPGQLYTMSQLQRPKKGSMA